MQSEGWPYASAAPRRRAARRGAPRPRQRGTCDGRSLNHFIRPPQQRRRNGKAERLGGLEVDDEIELVRLLNWEVARFGALQDPIYEVRSTATHVIAIFPVGHEAASACEPPRNCAKGMNHAATTKASHQMNILSALIRSPKWSRGAPAEFARNLDEICNSCQERRRHSKNMAGASGVRRFSIDGRRSDCNC